MINVLAVITGIGALLAIIRGGFDGKGKAAIAIGAIIVIALLKTLEAKFWGVVVMGGAVVILFFLPWLDRSPVKSIRYRPSWHKLVYGVWVFFFFVLGYLGVQAPSATGELVSQIGTLIYFGFFLLMPWWTTLGEFKPVPDRVTFAAH
jgi:ubiquinol-cytochrome c reductase cytochrome b subunit